MEQDDSSSGYSSSKEFSISGNDAYDLPGLLDGDNSTLSDQGAHFDVSTDEIDDMDVTMPELEGVCGDQ